MTNNIIYTYAGFYPGLKIWGGSLQLSITVNDCHAKYTHRFDASITCIYQGEGGGGGVNTKYSRGAGTCMYMWYPRHL